MKPRTLFGLVVASFAAFASADPQAPSRLPRVGTAETLVLPDSAPGPDGKAVPIAGLSGITWLGDDRYAAIMDNSDRLLLFQLDLGSDGNPRAVFNVRVVVLGRHLDYEDIAGCPPRLAARVAARARDRGEPAPAHCLVVCEETTPAIRVIDIGSGKLLGQVPIPHNLTKPRPNRGLEALTADPDGSHLWTANEEAMPADGPLPTDGTGTVVRLTRIGIPSADGPRRSQTAQFTYAVDAPHSFIRAMGGESFSGVVALVALGDERLLVLERSAGHGLPPFESRIFAVDVTGATDVSAIKADLADRIELPVAKTLLWKDSLGCNLEGLCLGPSLAAGARALVGVADNGGVGTPSQLVVFVLRTTSP
jgi:hypothetical protein